MCLPRNSKRGIGGVEDPATRDMFSPNLLETRKKAERVELGDIAHGTCARPKRA